MKKTAILFVLFLIIGCGERQPLISSHFVDMVSSRNFIDSIRISNQNDLAFWKKRMQGTKWDPINGTRYAAALVGRFRLYGDITDLIKADSIYTNIDSIYNHTLTGPLKSLVPLAIMRHHFVQADTILNRGIKLGMRKYVCDNLEFDVCFELGKYGEAYLYLNQLRANKDFNYYFRKSKLEHLHGEADSARASLERAVELSGKSNYLKWSALSNKGDLLLHQNKAEEAAKILQAALGLNPSDLHTLLNLGWISLRHDKDTIISSRIFELALKRNKLPDPLYRLYQLEQWKGNSKKATYYAGNFALQSHRKQYGQMYNKYLIELYSGVLKRPEEAEKLALQELDNRATPKTYAWYAYALYSNKKQQKAYKIIKKYVTGQPLEAVELYYTGKVLQASGYGFDAHSYFEAAIENPYDLDPAMLTDAKNTLEQ
jgi:hypothetical protein